ncbi:hypothetical protein NECID01_0610 [Nematocida sp. AWRm77]|nr:hypothetical protein NECID01_0610 [Nematocida sp. AWRm77]
MEHTNALLNTIPGQIVRDIEDEGVCYNIMVAGEGYIGKTSLVRELFGVEIAPERDEVFFHEMCDMACTPNPLAELIGTPASSTLDKVSITITATKTTLYDRGVKLYLTVYEVSNIGDSVVCEEDWVPIRNLILNRYEEYHMEEEMGRCAKDKRVHCCLYFLAPHAVPREIDLVAMEEIGKISNLIPVVSKADMLTQKEYKKIKESIFTSLVSRQISLFDCILVDECKKVVELSFMPLKYFTPRRVYPYSTQEGAESEINVLRDLLITQHAIDLVEMTEKFYESYRRSKLTVEILTCTESGLNEHFKRTIVLEEVKLKALSKRIEEKKKNYQALIAQHKQTIPEELL